jgi:hypothetical protein
MEIAAKVHEIIGEAEKELGLDWRSSWSRISSTQEGGLEVSVSRREVLARVASLIGDGSGVKLIDSGSGSGKLLWAVSSVVDIRRGPEHSSELLTQAIMGETMTELESKGDWLFVMLDDAYHGWVRSWYVSGVTPDEVTQYRKRAGVRIKANVTYVLSEPSPGSLPVSDITAGSEIAAGNPEGGFIHVVLPGGKEGYVDKNAVAGGCVAVEPDRNRVAERAKSFLGIPYIWGGTSAKGFDCSGLVKRVFLMEGVDLPRDADQQAGFCREAEKGPAAVGNLLFFGEGGHINHVAISLGGERFIHSYGDVRINSLSENDPLYEEKLAGKFLFTGDPFPRS